MYTALLRDMDISTNDAFHLAGGAGRLRIPAAMILDAAFAKEPDGQSVGFFIEDDAGTETISTPPKYARILRAHHLTPREAWIRLGGTIYANQAADACTPLIDWLRTACTAHTGNQPSAVRRNAPTVPLMNTSLETHLLELVRQDLSGQFLSGQFLPPAANQGNGPVATALGAFTYRE
jgi:hypothetical protein